VSNGENLDFATNEETNAYCLEIVSSMTTLFGIKQSEAIGRINRKWRGMEFVEKEDVAALLHETPGDWARIIYFGPSVNWWEDPASLEPVPYP
jgi:hypothetical protein